MENKMFYRSICLIIAFIMVLAGGFGYTVDATSESEGNPISYNPEDTLNFPQYPNPGYVRLQKDAQWVAGEDNIAKVTMKIDGKGVPKTTDVVLVIDRSGSMNDEHTVTNTYEKEVEVDKQVPYTEVQVSFSASNVRYQYFDGWWFFGSWEDAVASSMTINMTAYLDDNGKYVGYKEGSLNVSGYISSDDGYRLNGSSGKFNSWTSFDDNDCLDAVIQVFGSKTSSVIFKESEIIVRFPSDRDILKNVQSYYVIKVKEIQTFTEEYQVKKIESAKEAAKEFVEALLSTESQKSLNKIGVVSYSSSGYGNGTAYVDSQLSNNNNLLNSAIQGIKATGGTHIQAGIKKAQDVLSGSTADNRYIVVLSDGDPTFSYKASKLQNRTQDDLNMNYPSDINYVLNSFNNTTIGSGSAYEYYKSGWNGYDYRYYIGNIRITNNGIPTISQALMAKRDGIEIYSVGFNVASNNNAIYTMKHVASSPDMFYETSDNLVPVFSNIAGRIAKAGTESKVDGSIIANDSVGYNFEILTDIAHPMTSSFGTTSVTDNGKKINWNLGDITESTATLTYYIKLNVSGGSSIAPDTMLDTGGISSIVYKNHRDVLVTKDFPLTQLSAGEGTLNIKYYLSDINGNPVNNEGEIIPYENREILSSRAESAELNSIIEVASYAGELGEYINQSKIARDSDGNEVASNMAATRATIYLNFPYYPEPSYKVSYDGNGASGIAPIDSKSYRQSQQVTVLGRGELNKSGYSFKGWNTSSDSSAEFIQGSTFSMPAHNVKLYAIWDKSTYNLRVNYKLDGYETPLAIGTDGQSAETYTLESGNNINIRLPFKRGLSVASLNTKYPSLFKPSIDSEYVKGTMPSSDAEIDIYYTTNENKLLDNNMYYNKSAIPVGNAKEQFDIVIGMDYTFGFKVLLGNTGSGIYIEQLENNISIDTESFMIYDDEGKEIKNSITVSNDGNKLKISFADSVILDEKYTITYKINGNNEEQTETIKVADTDGAPLKANESIYNPIKIRVRTMPGLE